MRNATVAALIYEFLFDVYRLIEAERGCNEWLPDEHGVLHEAFNNWCTGCWEWSTSVLEEVGAIKPLQLQLPTDFTHTKRASKMRSWYSYPVMTMEECRIADFSQFESFDNYCYAMFTFERLSRQIGQWRNGKLDLAVHSPRFMEDVASQDDIFLVDGVRSVNFRRNRFEEKVMTRWREMDARVFRRKESA